MNVAERLDLVVLRNQLVVEQPLDLQHHTSITAQLGGGFPGMTLG